MAKAPQFSIVTPTWNRLDGRLQRCIQSVASQTHHDFEHIVVDDGSKDGTWDWLQEETLRYDWLEVMRVEHQGRVRARNEGMRAARGEWLTWLDSDDALDPMYLETFAHFIEKEPEVAVWVTGAVVHGVRSGGPKEKYGGQQVPYWTGLRRAWVPPLDKNGPYVHKLFRSGKVGTGMFVFKRECLETTGLLPESWVNHNKVADGVDEWLGLPPGTLGYGSAGPPDRPLGLVGNPWGDDFCLHQKLCMHFESRILGGERGKGTCLYYHYVR